MAAVSNSSSDFIRAMFLGVLVVALVHTQLVDQVRGQSCPFELTNLDRCAPFVVPGLTNVVPSADCCSALQSVHHDCLCNTLRIASRLPSMCQLPPLACGDN